jgi:hypothetical protein
MQKKQFSIDWVSFIMSLGVGLLFGVMSLAVTLPIGNVAVTWIAFIVVSLLVFIGLGKLSGAFVREAGGPSETAGDTHN